MKELLFAVRLRYANTIGQLKGEFKR